MDEHWRACGQAATAKGAIICLGATQDRGRAANFGMPDGRFSRTWLVVAAPGAGAGAGDAADGWNLLAA